MRIRCAHCSELFGASIEQLGDRVRCPLCDEEMLLPDVRQEQQPWWHPAQYLSTLGSLIFHMALVLILALIPQADRDTGLSVIHEEVVVGQMPTTTPLSDTQTPELQSDSATRLESVRDANATAVQQNDVQVVGTADSNFVPDGELTIDIASASAQQPSPGAFSVGSPKTSFGKLSREDKSWDRMLEKLRKNGLDIVITFDSTGSMTYEIDQVKAQIGRIGRRLMKLVPKARISICTYRDKTDAYVVKGLPLTNDLSVVQKYLRSIFAKGGRDFPEAVHEGLHWSMIKNDFRPKARKIILLFGDAPPHAHKRNTCIRLAANFRRNQEGIVSTVTCRSPSRIPDFVAIAEAGGGEAFTTRNEAGIMKQLMILVFGSQYEQAVKRAFALP